MTCDRKIGPYDCCSVVQGDCLELMKALPDGCVDVVITDPPYGVGFEYANHNDNRAHYLRDLPKWSDAMLRLGCSVCLTPGIDNVCHWPQPRWVICWLKTNSMGANRLSGPKAVSRNLWEPILWYGSYPKFPPSRDTIQSPLGTSNEGTGHPCPKPISLMTQLVEIASAEFDTILDPFCGSGTTLVAAKKLGRHFLGFEISPEYCEIARDRLARIDAQPSLFEDKPEQLSLGG